MSLQSGCKGSSSLPMFDTMSDMTGLFGLLDDHFETVPARQQGAMVVFVVGCLFFCAYSIALHNAGADTR